MLFKELLNSVFYLILGLLTGLILFMLVTIFIGCNEINTTADGVYIAGIYETIEGHQDYYDNQGVENHEDIPAGLPETVNQSRDIIAVNNCMGILIDGEIRCDTDVFAYDSVFGAYYINVQGKVTFDEEFQEIRLDIQTYGSFPMIGYEGTNTLTLRAVRKDNLSNYAKTGSYEGG